MPAKKRGHSQIDASEEPRTITKRLEPLRKRLVSAASDVPAPEIEPTTRDLLMPLVLEYLNTQPGPAMALPNTALFGRIRTFLNQKIAMEETSMGFLRTEILYRLRLAKRATQIASFLPGKRVCEQWKWRRPEEPFDEERCNSVREAVASVNILPEPKYGEGYFDPKVPEFLTQVCYDLNWKPNRIIHRLERIKQTIDRATSNHNVAEHISTSAISAV